MLNTKKGGIEGEEEDMLNQLTVMAKLRHENILRLLYHGEGLYQKPKGSKQVKY